MGSTIHRHLKAWSTTHSRCLSGDCYILFNAFSDLVLVMMGFIVRFGSVAAIFSIAVFCRKDILRCRQSSKEGSIGCPIGSPDTLCCHIGVSLRAATGLGSCIQLHAFQLGAISVSGRLHDGILHHCCLRKIPLMHSSRPNVGFGCGRRVELGGCSVVLNKEQFSG
jgi:hypothetical protein